MIFNLKRISILFITLFTLSIVCSSAFSPVIDGHLRLNSYTKTDYFKPFVHLPFTDEPVTRYYEFTLNKIRLSPDGFERTVWSVNDQYPGPLIRANKGDRIVVNVTNKLNDPSAIHWHGMFLYGTNWYDGVPGQTQCPIPSDVSFVYNFTTGEQHGTFWYHSHFVAQYMDGLHGGIIIHDPDDPYLGECDFEYLVTLTDWHHRTSGLLLSKHQVPNHFGYPPVPDTPLISGRGRYDCNAAPTGSKCNPNAPLAVYNVKKYRKYRFRIVNTSANALFVFSIDEHKLRVIEVEGQYVKPTMIEKLPVNIGQRYSVIVSANRPIGNYWVRATLDDRCVRVNNNTINFDSAIDWNGRGILHYEGADNLNPTSEESTEEFKACRDLDSKHMEPLYPTRYDGQVTDFFNLTFRFQRNEYGLLKALVNESSYIPQYNDPTLAKITRNFPPEDLPKESNSLVFDNLDGIVEIYLFNHDRILHPFHMHGYAFAVMFVGEKGEIPDESKYNMKNPVIRDTVTVPENGYLVIRFIANNPGIWAFHCHIEWHIQIGMLIQLVSLPSILRDLAVPQDVDTLCIEYDYQKKKRRSTKPDVHERTFNPIEINEIRNNKIN